MYVPVRGFEPDADETGPGVIPSLDGFIPTVRGMAAAPSPVDRAITGLTATGVAAPSIHGADTLQLPDGTYLTLVAIGGGTTTKIWKAGNTTWSSFSNDYSKTANALWTFAQFGDVTLAAQRGEQIQFASANSFSIITNAPKAAIVTTALEFVLAFDTNEATYGDSPNRWWCSAAGDYTTWTANISVQAATGLLEESPGRIVAAKPRGPEVVAYKQRAMHVGRYVGPPFVWQWDMVSQEVGTFGPHCVVQARTHHFFPGPDGIYMFDGVRPQSIATNKVDDFFLNTLDFENAWRIVGAHDETRKLVWWWYPTLTSDEPLGAYLAYNYRSDRWGYGELPAHWVFQYAQPGLTYHDIGTLYSTYNDLPDEAYDSLGGGEGSPVMAIMADARSLKTLTGAAGTSSIWTHRIGMDNATTLVTRIRPRFKAYPTTGAGSVLTSNNMGQTATTAVTGVGLSRGAFDYVRSARWQQLRQTYTGNVEILGYWIESTLDGLE